MNKFFPLFAASKVPWETPPMRSAHQCHYSPAIKRPSNTLPPYPYPGTMP